MSRSATSKSRSVKGEYIETDTGNKISRKAKLEGTANIMLAGRCVIMADVHLRGDLHRIPTQSSSSTTAISIGRYTIISTGCVIKPPLRVSRGQMSFFPLKVGENVYIGPRCIVSSISIGSHVHIATDCVLGPFSIIKDNVKIMPHSVIPANMVISSNSVVAGQPARVIGEVPEGWGAGAASGETVEGGELRDLIRSIR